MIKRRLQEFCKEISEKGTICGKPVQIKLSADQYFEGEPTGEVYQVLACGHSRIVPKEQIIEHETRNRLWDRLLPHQQEFVEFAEKANLKVICRDEMGLGKTIETAFLIRENADKFTANFTKFCVIVVPTGSIYNWEEELIKWFDLEKPQSFEHLMLRPQVVINSGQLLTPMTKVIIIPWSRLGDKKLQEQLQTIGVASLVVDECHFYKDIKSARTKNLIELAKLAGIDAPKIFLSGTLVENRISEMNVALNLIDPRTFYSWNVLNSRCLQVKNKSLGLRAYYRDWFFNVTKNYIIGRKKADINLPLPEIEYHTLWCDPKEHESNQEIIKAYNTTLDELEQMLNARIDAASIIGFMQQLRHHTGRMKILSAAIWADTWMTLNPGEKLCIGIHHKAVREYLAKVLAHRNPLQMSDESPRVKDEIERDFRDGKSNLLIASVLSAGVGRNLQFCKNALILERQWNKSKEEQFAQRFWRIITDADGRVKTKFSTEDTVRIYTMNAVDSFDEFFEDLIHLKGIIVDSTEESEELPDEDFIMKLAQEVVRKRMRWTGV